MPSYRQSLPPLGTLATFEAAARLGGFTLAAAELGVTQAAVSRQIKALEGDLNTPLFQRRHRKVVLTPAGEALARAVGAGLERIAEAVEVLRRPSLPGQVTLGTTLAFTHFWLLPRLPALRAEHPGVRLRLVADDTPADLGRDPLDLVVRYGTPPFDDGQTLAVMGETVCAVCSPGFAARVTESGPAGLSRLPLIATDWTVPSWLTWRRWGQQAGLGADQVAALGRAADRSTLRFNHYTDTIQAAVAGQGVALGWMRLLDGELRAGRLMRLGTLAATPPDRYALVVPTRHPTSPAADQVAGWIAARFRAEDA